LRVLIAPDKFKGSLTALQVAEAIAAGITHADPAVECELVPMADGGDGTAAALAAGTGGEMVTVSVTGPLGHPVEAQFAVLGDGETAVVEMAAASGLVLVPPEKRNPLSATTYGTGELLRAALDRGCRRLLVGIGGSATNDGGAGMAQALGARLLTTAGTQIPPGGAGLAQVTKIEVDGLDPRVAQTEFLVACDVDNPLTGDRGASAVYGPQKGATPSMVMELDANLARYGDLLKRDLGKDVAHLPGAGAAGGLGAGLAAFCDARLASGVDLVMDALGLPARIRAADLVFVGEGQVDAQTAYGKTPAGVARAAREAGVPVIALGGSVALDGDMLHQKGLQVLCGITNGPISLEEAMRPEVATRLVRFTAEEVFRAVLIGREIGQQARANSGTE